MNDMSEVRLRALGSEIIVAQGVGGALTVRVAEAPKEAAVPLVALAATWEGRRAAGRRTIDWPRGNDLVAVSYAMVEEDNHEVHRFEQLDEAWRLRVTTEWVVVADSLRGRTVVINDGIEPLSLAAVSSIVVGGLLDSAAPDASVLTSANTWLAEHRWQTGRLAALLPDINREIHRQNSRGTLTAASTSTWSTARAHPGGYAEESATGTGIGWQVESTAGWSWELGEQAGWCWVACFGPDDVHQQASISLEPGQQHATPWSIIDRQAAGGWQAAAAAQSSARTAVRQPHPDAQKPALVYNDYLNTLMADPHEPAVRSLASAAASVGAEVYCIDAGWYDEARDGWWDSVGEWKESPTRFPSGLGIIADDLRADGVELGLWLEPEVVGVRSPLAQSLPDSAFFVRDGHRVRENGRYLLDISDPAARVHLDDTVDRLVADIGVGYLKLDYNVEPGVGTSSESGSLGEGLRKHSTAYLDWLAGVYSRHPALVIESCASGGMRADGEVLRLAQLQSTSDQQDFRLYAPIAANAPAAIPIAQCANWASILPDMTHNEVAFALVTGLAGRLYLSGWLDRVSDDALRLVREAADLYLEDRGTLIDTVPFWPLGLAEWTDEWIALGHMRPDGSARLHVWHRGEADAVKIDLGDRFGRSPVVEAVFPRVTAGWSERLKGGVLEIDSDAGCRARVYRIQPKEVGFDAHRTPDKQ